MRRRPTTPFSPTRRNIKPMPRSRASRSSRCWAAAPRSSSAPSPTAPSASWSPATKQDALSMLDGIQAHEMLKGVRGGDPVNREALADVIVKVSQLVSDFPEIVELDLNPVFATKKDAIAADVRIVVDFEYKPRPKPRATEEIAAAMNRISPPTAVA